MIPMKKENKIRSGYEFENRAKCISLNSDSVIAWIEKQGIKLCPYQKNMLRDMCEGREFISFRGAGRGTMAGYLGEYVAHLFSENNYEKEPVKKYPFQLAYSEGFYSNPEFFDIERSLSSLEQWKKEYSLEYDYGGKEKE